MKVKMSKWFRRLALFGIGYGVDVLIVAIFFPRHAAPAFTVSGVITLIVSILFLWQTEEDKQS